MQRFAENSSALLLNLCSQKLTRFQPGVRILMPIMLDEIMSRLERMQFVIQVSFLNPL